MEKGRYWTRLMVGTVGIVDGFQSERVTNAALHVQ
jgi:hypothetical protein